MEIGTMSAEELAKSFETGGQNQNQNQQQNQQQQFQQQQQQPPVEVGAKSSEELAAEAIEKAKNGDVDTTGKTPEEIEAAKVQAELEAKKAGRPKTKLDDSFKQGLDKLFKEDKLSPFSDGTDTGYVLPESWEDVVDLIEENKKIWVDSSKAKDKEELYTELLATKTPAMQFLIQNSETYRNPQDLIPLLTAVHNLEYSNSLDPAIEEDQVRIIRSTLSIQGLSTEDIESEIDDLKERGRMESRAKTLKPVLDRYNEAQTEKVLQQKEAEDSKKAIFWDSYYKNLEDTIFKAKEIDGIKFKNEHKQLIASTLVPDEKLGGLPIYTIIDKLVAAGDFTKLAKIALIGVDEKLFDTYFLTKKADKAAEGVQRVLRQSGVNSNTTEFDADETKARPIKKSSGYGYFG